MMPVSLAFLFVAAGLAMLITGGEILVSGAIRLAKRSGMSTLVIGLTVVAFGTSVPELFVSLTASLQGHPDIMIGNVVGSNIANIGLILGFSALLTPLHLTLREVWMELLLVIGGSVILIFCTSLGYFPRSVGFIFILALVSYTYFAFTNKKTNDYKDLNAEEKAADQPSIILPLLLIIGGLVLLAGGSNMFIKGAADAARYFGVSELVIGLTLAAIGTSLPELASSISAIRRNDSGLLIGNVIGSNMFNLFMVLGLTAVIMPFHLSPELLRRDLPVMIAFTLILIPILHNNSGTRQWHGLLFLISFAAYYYILL
jgi:cation:H+ antiporter